MTWTEQRNELGMRLWTNARGDEITELDMGHCVYDARHHVSGTVGVFASREQAEHALTDPGALASADLRAGKGQQ